MAATSRWHGHGSAHYAPQPDGLTPTGFGVAANPPCAHSGTQTTLTNLTNTTHGGHHPNALKPPENPETRVPKGSRVGCRSTSRDLCTPLDSIRKRDHTCSFI